MIEVRELNRPDEWAPYTLAWQALWRQTRAGSFFQSPEWLAAYWRHFGAGQKLRLLIAVSDGRPIGILPLVVTGQQTRLGTVKVLTYPLDDWGTRFGPIGPNPTATLVAGMRHVRDTRRDWQLLDLRWVDNDGCDHGRTQRAMQAAGFQGHKGRWRTAGAVELSGGWDEYLAERSPQLREQLAHAEDSLAALGTVEYHRYRPLGAVHDDGDPCWDLFDECAALSAKAAAAGMIHGHTLCSPAAAEFFRQTHETAAHCGALDLNLLVIDGRPAAFAYNYHFQGRIDGLRMAADPELARGAAQQVLLARMIADSFARGDQLLELGSEDTEALAHWQTRASCTYHYSHYPLVELPALALRAKRWWASRGRVAGTLEFAAR